MAREGSSSRGHADGEVDRLLHESEASDVSETIENVAREVKKEYPSRKELEMKVKNCNALLRSGRKATVDSVSDQIPGINRLSKKTPKKLKLKASRAEMKRRRENPTPKIRRQKKSTGGTGFYHRNRDTPNPEERRSSQEKMRDIVERHQTKGNIIGGVWCHKLLDG